MFKSRDRTAGPEQRRTKQTLTGLFFLGIGKKTPYDIEKPISKC